MPLIGTLRRAGNRLRITAQLVQTATGHSSWADRYDRELQDIFEVQDEIARSISQALRITLSPQEEKALARKPTDNAQSYDYFLRGRSYARRETRSDLDFAMQMFDSAIGLDPGFALAHAGIANACATIHEFHEQNRRWIDKGLAACQRAFELEPQLPEALVARARISYVETRTSLRATACAAIRGPMGAPALELRAPFSIRSRVVRCEFNHGKRAVDGRREPAASQISVTTRKRGVEGWVPHPNQRTKTRCQKSPIEARMLGYSSASSQLTL